MRCASHGVCLIIFGLAGLGIAAGPTTKADKSTDPSAADADLRARAAWVHGELARVAGIVAKTPPTSRPVLRTRDGRIAPDPRPTPAKALEAAREADKKVDAAVEAALAKLKSVAAAAATQASADKDRVSRQLTLARLQVNEAVELVLLPLKDTDVPTQVPTWLGAPAKELSPAAAKALDAEVGGAVLEGWQTDHPDNLGGMGDAGAGGKESVYALGQGQTVRGLADVASVRVTWRVNPKVGKASVMATTPNFTLVLLRPIIVDGMSLEEGSLLERRLSVWWAREKSPEVSAAEGKGK